MTTMNIPNRFRITVTSGPAAYYVEGLNWVVEAILWSLDETAVQSRRFVRYATEDEADRRANELRDASWEEIEEWYRGVSV
jgi:hypothetical protein